MSKGEAKKVKLSFERRGVFLLERKVCDADRRDGNPG